ncbi:MAG: magnesium protoporphyrin IX methyltransferase [Pseudomonadota bacterium]
MRDYLATRDRVEEYFDSTATTVWERLTSDAPVSGIRATVRAGRDEMRDLLLAQLPDDLRGKRILDAGCGTGAISVALAERGAEVTAVDISPALIAIAQERVPRHLAGQINWVAGDMRDALTDVHDAMIAMDSLIYYRAEDIAALLTDAKARVDGPMIFTVAPRTRMLMAMWRIGKLFPRSDRSPVMIPQTTAAIAHALRAQGARGHLRELKRVTSGFYISQALSFRGGSA